MNDQRPIYPPAPGEPQDAIRQHRMKTLGCVGSITVKLDTSDPAHPELDDTTDHIVMRIAYTPDTGRTIADLIHVLVMAQLLVGQSR